MNLQTIVPRLAALSGLLALLSACGAGGGSGSGPDPIEDGAILKFSYFRAFQEPRTKKLEPNFRVVMSESWRDRMGDGPREPLARAAPGRIYMGYVADLTMAKHLKKLRDLGLDDLKSRPTEELKPEEFGRASVDPQKTSFIRVFTIGNEKVSKSYFYPDQQTNKELIEKFVNCEKFISRACEYAIQVRTMSEPLPGREK